MCGDVWCLFSKPNIRMTKNFPSGIDELKWVDWLVFQTITLPWWLMCVVYLPTSSPPNYMLFLIIYFRQWTGLVLMNLSSSLSAKICFNLIGNFMQKRNLTKKAILFTSPLPAMRSGLMKLDDDKGNKDCIQQRHRNNELMCDRNWAV